MNPMDDLEMESMEEEDTQEGKYLTFIIGNEIYGLEIRFITEIIGVQRITELPETPPFVKGVINLRGKVIPVIDVRLRFELPERDYDERTCIIVVNFNDMPVGLIVDSVAEVMDIPEAEIEKPPKVNRGSSSRYIMGLGKVGGEVKILLDVQRLLFLEEMEQLKTSLENE